VAFSALALIVTAGCLTQRDGGGGSDGPDGAGGAAGGDGSGTASADGGAAPAAVGCECAEAATAPYEACEFARVECEYYPYCLDWLGCFEDCADEEWTASCLDACDAGHPAAAAAGYGIVQCVCAACALDPTCAPGC
jgi:hypothetical protein